MRPTRCGRRWPPTSPTGWSPPTRPGCEPRPAGGAAQLERRVPVKVRAPARRQLVVAAGLIVVGVGTVAPAQAAGKGHDWSGVAACESGGDWSLNTGNGYFGGLQFNAGSWKAA